MQTSEPYMNIVACPRSQPGHFIQRRTPIRQNRQNRNTPEPWWAGGRLAGTRTCWTEPGLDTESRDARIRQGVSEGFTWIVDPSQGAAPPVRAGEPSGEGGVMAKRYGRPSAQYRYEHYDPQW